MKKVLIGGKAVGHDEPPYVVAEIGINHNGDIEIANKLIEVAVKAGCDAVKFQKRTVEIVYQNELDKPREVPREMLERAISRKVLPAASVDRIVKSDFKDTRQGDQKYALEFGLPEYSMIDAYCKEKGIRWFASPWDVESLRFLCNWELPCFKVASACNEDDELLAEMRKTGKPIILSTGMTDLVGVHEAVRALGSTRDLVILHCTSVYPKAIAFGQNVLRFINLKGIETLRREFEVPVGFSSHDAGIMPSYAAAARGACMIEVHVTLNRGMYGSDQGSSLEPDELERLVRAVKELPVALGDGKIEVYEAEKEAQNKLRRVRRYAGMKYGPV